MIPALAFATPDKLLEAAGDSAHRRAQRANRAAQDVLKDRNRAERDANDRLNKRLTVLQNTLKQRLLGDDGAVTDFKRFSVSALAADVDRMIADTTRHLAQDAKPAYDQMVTLGDNAADEPMRAAQLRITPGLPGLDSELVTAAFDNTVDLLSEPMRQFGTDVKVALRQVALAGENKFDAIARLRQQIGGQGFDSAQYKAERIVRTELGRSFNQATYNRLLGLAVDFPFLRKGWRAASDSRTRQGHRQAGKTYMRGSGIAIADLFVIQVYDERNPGQVKLIGVCRLRFPVDPQAEPAGRLAAAATIMCRCNAFVDFDMADFAQFTAQQIQLALGGVLPPVVPGPQPVDPGLAKTTAYYKGRFYFASAADAGAALTKTGAAGTIVKSTRGYSIKQTGTGAFYGPKGWGKPPAPAAPKAARGKGVPAIDVKHQAGGAPVSNALNLTPDTYARPGRRSPILSAPNQAKVKKALAVIDSVHGDGNLPTIPVNTVTPRQARKGMLAGYSRSMSDERPVQMIFSSRALQHAPHINTFHETGHFLDHVGFDGDHKAFSSLTDPGFEGWRTAVKNSQAIKQLASWREGKPGDGVVPGTVLRGQVDYMLSTKEVWARSYAQWVAVKSKNPAVLKELRTIQAASQNGPVPAEQRYNAKLLGSTPTPGTWDYPWTWQDEDFAPIEAEIDTIMERVGWRTKTAK